MKHWAHRAVLAIAFTGAAAASTGVVHESARGVIGAIEVEYPPPGLAAKPVTDPNSPILVRVTPTTDDRYLIEYLGLVSGDYNVLEHLQQRDGREVRGLDDLPVRVFTQLPPGHGTDVFENEPPSASVVSRYEVIAGAAIALWLAAPIVALTRRALRRKPHAVAPPPAPEPTTHDLLRAAVRDAQGRELTTHERARIELLLFRALTQDNGHAHRSPDELAGAIAALRANQRTEGVVLAVERWLHSQQGEGPDAALRALDAHLRAPAETRA